MNFAFSTASLTVDEFFGEKIVANLAAFLGIPSNKIRVMDIISAEQTRRRRRAVSPLAHVVVRISFCNTRLIPRVLIFRSDLGEKCFLEGGLINRQLVSLSFEIFSILQNNNVLRPFNTLVEKFSTKIYRPEIL